MHALHVLQQLFIKSLHVLMVLQMLLNHRHLPTADTGAYIRHTIVIPNLLVLIVRIALAVLRGIHHNLPPLILVTRNQSTATGGV